MVSSRKVVAIFIFISHHTNLSVPTSPPSNITVGTLSSTIIRVSWEPLPSVSPTSPITQYEVELSQGTFDAIPMNFSVTVNSDSLNTEITDLEEFVEYSIRVRAHTSAGAGPYSHPVVVTTLQDCKYTPYIAMHLEISVLLSSSRS